MDKKEEEAAGLIKELRAYKEKSGLSYDKLGKALDVHSITIFNWFRGHQKPSEMGKKLIRAFLKDKES